MAVLTDTDNELEDTPIEVVELVVPMVVSTIVPVKPLIPAPEDEVRVNNVEVVVVPVSLKYVETSTNGMVYGLSVELEEEATAPSDEEAAAAALDEAETD